MGSKSKPKKKQYRQTLKRITRYSTENQESEDINGQQDLNPLKKSESKGFYCTDNGRVISRLTALRHMAAGATAVALTPVMLSSVARAEPSTKRSEMIKLALVGGAHIHAPNFAERMAEFECVETKYVWDPNSETAKARQAVNRW